MGRLGEQQLGTDQLGSPGQILDADEWRVRVDGDIERDLYNAKVVDTANPFGNFAIAKIDDVDGKKFDTYTRGTKVEFFAKRNSGDAYTSRFVGYVVEARELDQQGADALEVEAYSFDHFLRRDTVTNDQSGKTLENALKDIIQTDTPVTWNASNVTVEDPQTLTESYRGENVENALLSLRSKSGGEDFGVNAKLEFFWRPLESESAPRDIDNSQWINFDLPEEGKRTINEVTVFFENGTRNVTVDNSADKDELQSSLGTLDPVVLSEEVSRPDIDNLDDARAVGRRILQGKKSILTGTVTTFGLIDANPGDIIDITITPRGIDDEFRIAELDYRWGRGQTVITVAEKRGDQDDLLVNLSDTVKRVELDGVDRDAVQNTVTSTNLRALIAVTGDVDGTNYDSDAFTNVARNKIRAAWGGGSTISVSDIAVGNDASTATRSDQDLGNELERVSASETLPDDKTARYTASFSTTDIREIGVFDSGGDLVCRTTIPETGLSASVSVTVDLTVSNDSGFGSGVVTNDGQTVTRDIIADNSPNVPKKYAYGDGSTDPTEGDTALGNQLVSVTLGKVLQQEADTTTEFQNVTSIGSNDPVGVSSGSLNLLQSAYHIEGENFTLTSTQTGDSDSSEGSYEVMGSALSDNNSVNIDYTIPAANARVAARLRNPNDPDSDGSYEGFGFDIIVDGNKALEFADNWLRSNSDYAWNDGSISADISGSTNVNLDGTGGSGERTDIDLVVVYDDRFSYTFDNSVDSNNHLSGPELYPDLYELAFDNNSTRQSLTGGVLEQTWDDTTNKQKLELSNDGGSSYTTVNNSSSADVDFSVKSTEIRARVGLSRYGSASSTPTSGVNGQSVSDHDLFWKHDAITPEDIGIVDVEGVVKENTINGKTIREAAQLDTNDTALTRSTFAALDIVTDERVLSSESVEWAND